MSKSVGPINEDRFWAQTVSEGDCLRWLGFIRPNGYGEYSSRLAHRVAYELRVGPIPAGRHLDHLCRNRWCVEPEHLEAVTQRVNNQRAWEAHPFCPKGHDRRIVGSYFAGDKNVRCKQCQRDYTREWKRRRKALGRQVAT